jgi:hypothetical protein
MKLYWPALVLGTALLYSSCNQPSESASFSGAQPAATDTTLVPAKDSAAVKAVPKPAHTETLQFVSFDGNGDYYIAYFINSSGDLQSFYYNDVIADSLNGKVMRVQWQMDTFYAAGDGDTPYEGESLLSYEILSQKPFMSYKAPGEIEAIIQALPAVAALNENSVTISSWPKTAKDCYEVSVYAREPEPGSDVLYGKLKYIYKVYQQPSFRVTGPEIRKEDNP